MLDLREAGLCVAYVNSDPRREAGELERPACHLGMTGFSSKV